MKLSGPTTPLALMTLALAAAFPAAAQTNAELLNELRALRERVNQLEAKLSATKPAAPAAGQWGMTPEQARELNRTSMKVEAAEDNLEAQGLKLLTITGYMDPTFIYNRAQDRAGFQFLNSVGGGGYNYDNSYMGAVSIDFTKETESGTRYKLTLVPNRGTDSVVSGRNRLVHEASVSIPLEDLQTRLIAGHIPDWSGYEYLQPTLNKLITHNLLFDFTLPTAYTGVGMDVTSGKWWLRGMVANVNGSIKDSGNKKPALVGRVDYSKGEFDGWGAAALIGEVPNFASPAGKPSMATMVEVDGYFNRGDWSLAGQVSIGQQKDAAITPDPVTGGLRDSSWWGLSGLVGYKFTPRLEGIFRGDYLNNSKNGGGLFGFTSADGRNGIGPDPMGDPNVGANRYALSFGLSYLLDTNTTLKAEYRIDGADRAVFEYVSDGTYRKSNQLFGASVLVAF